MSILRFFRQSLRNKLLLAFLGVGIIPFVLLLSYAIFLSQNKIIEKTVEEQYSAAGRVQELIRRHLATLQREVHFLSTLDVMDDIIVDDIDKRIARLLEKKAQDYDSELSFIVINNHNKVISSSHKSMINQAFNLINTNKPFILSGKKILFFAPVYSSFNAKKIGTIVLEYPLKYLNRYLIHKSDVHSYMFYQNSKDIIGERLTIALQNLKNQGSYINEDYIIVYKNFDYYLQGWYLVYFVDKTKALGLLYDFIRFMLYLALVMIPLIIYISFKVSLSILKPIEQLTHFADEITKTQDYSKEIYIESEEDEITILRSSFNKMLQTTKHALTRLEEENRLRLQRFTRLIEIFNTIIQTNSEKECIETSLREISKLSTSKSLYFEAVEACPLYTEYVELYVNDFEKNQKLYYGYIAVGIENFTDQIEANFYHSIAAMIALQLDKIRLIDKTTAASRAKSAFISNMSHELRTPLNSIIGFSQYMLSYEQLTDNQQDTIANIESSAHYLLGMINDILDIAKIEAGKMEPRILPVSLSELLQSVYEMLEPLALDKGISLKLDISRSLQNKDFETDPKIFQQIIINLLSNAIKFTDEGYVSISVYEENNYLYVKIQDSGIGISKEQIKSLFQEFTQLNNTLEASKNGTGLGLAISKKLAHILNGDVKLYSDGVGCGVESILILPFKSTYSLLEI